MPKRTIIIKRKPKDYWAKSRPKLDQIKRRKKKTPSKKKLA